MKWDLCALSEFCGPAAIHQDSPRPPSLLSTLLIPPSAVCGWRMRRIWMWMRQMRMRMWQNSLTLTLTWHFSTAVLPVITYSSCTCTVYFWLTTVKIANIFYANCFGFLGLQILRIRSVGGETIMLRRCHHPTVPASLFLLAKGPLAFDSCIVCSFFGGF